MEFQEDSREKGSLIWHQRKQCTYGEKSEINKITSNIFPEVWFFPKIGGIQNDPWYTLEDSHGPSKSWLLEDDFPFQVVDF